MANPETLYIPMNIQALAVNDHVRDGQSFLRWEMNFRSLEEYVSPIPDGPTSSWRGKKEAIGVYLHWTLPDALRQGRFSAPDSDSEEEDIQFPLVPNRWLVLRYSGSLEKRTATAWVVESDHLDGNNGTSTYLDPFSPAIPKQTLIGRKFDLNGWKENHDQELFLTAIGPGELTFSAYQPYVNNVFSIHDPLDGVKDKEILSYLVVGWYSDPSADILASIEDSESFEEILAHLEWRLVDVASEKTAQRIFCHGMVHGLQWDLGRKATDDIRPVGSDVTLSLGDTAIDALSALIAEQSSEDDTIQPHLLEAFQYDLLPMLDEPDGRDLLYQAIYKAWFGASQGGHRFVITKQPTDSETVDPDVENDMDEPGWLIQLNQDQAKYDHAARVLNQHQWNLYRLWWTYGRFGKLKKDYRKDLEHYDSRISDKNFKLQLDKNKDGSFASQVQEKLAEVKSLLQAIPHGASQDALLSSIADYAAKQKLPDEFELKRVNADPFYHPADPVVLIAGAKASGLVIRTEPLVCRFAEELIHGCSLDDQDIDVNALKGIIPTLDLSQLPTGIEPLVAEFFLLDPDNAQQVATGVLEKDDAETLQQVRSEMESRTAMWGNSPDHSLEPWQQAWSPLYLMWEVNYYPIPFVEEGTENWKFDGRRYQWSGEGGAQEPLKKTFRGRTFLTPQSNFNFHSRLTDFRRRHPQLQTEELEALDRFIASTHQWDFLSQSLEGLTSQLAYRNPEMNRTPGTSAPDLSQLIQFQTQSTPILGETPHPKNGWKDSEFQDFRSGQFTLESLTLVDTFGQSVEVVTEQSRLQTQPYLAPHLKPQHWVNTMATDRFVEFSPRLLQPARLNFDYVSSRDDDRVIHLSSDVNPICAWIVPNHLDRALECFDPHGKHLGKVKVIQFQGEPTVFWEAASENEYPTVASLQEDFPHLAEFLEGIVEEGANAYDFLLQVVDSTLWTIDPLGDRSDANVSVWVGRPLVLARAQLRYELEGEPIWDPSWQYTFESEPPGFLNHNFPICLGQVELSNDGLIGYFLNQNYRQFNAVQLPSPTSFAYFKTIEPGNFVDLKFMDPQPQYVTLLIDPRASVHATTDILPTAILNLPTRYIEPALAAMEIHFHVGPFLSNLEGVEAGVETGMEIGDEAGDEEKQSDRIFIPMPAVNTGQWNFVVQDGDQKQAYELKSTDQNADLTTDAPVLRSGWLHWSRRQKTPPKD